MKYNAVLRNNDKETLVLVKTGDNYEIMHNRKMWVISQADLDNTLKMLNKELPLMQELNHETTSTNK